MPPRSLQAQPDNETLSVTMKQWKPAVILGAVATTFVAGMYVGSYGDTRIAQADHSETHGKLPTLTIDETTADYSGSAERDLDYLPIRLFVRNQSSLLAEGRYVFKLSINQSELNSEYLWKLETAMSEKDRKIFLDFLRNKSEKNEKNSALVAYLERGRFKDGLNHEPTGLPDAIIYNANIYADVKLEPGAMGIIELKAQIPESLYFFSYAVTVGSSNEQPPSTVLRD
jgi:hypothetical protein